MRWDELFRDLEGQLEAHERAELQLEVADRTRREWAQVRLADRLRPLVGEQVGLDVAGSGGLSGRLVDMGPDWLLLDLAPSGRAALVPLGAVLTVRGLSRWTATPEGEVGRRLRLAYALRGIARDRRAVLAVLTDGSAVQGTIDRVGADFFELAEHPPGEPRRAPEVRSVRALPFPALASLHSE